MIATALAVDDSAGGWRAKAERLLVEGAGALGSGTATWILKGATHRERPDSSNARSFPSGHTSSAFASRVASLENLDDMALPRALDLGLRATVTGLAAATGWARVEAGVHYPSDVLAGAALGNFVERLVLGGVSGPGRPASVHARVGRSGVAVALRFEGGLRLSP